MSNQHAMNSSSGAIVTIQSDRLDVVHAPAAKEMLRTAAQSASSDLHVDMRNVGFVDSTGLGALVAARKALRPDRSLCLHNVTPNVRKLLGLTKLDRVFEIR